MLSLIVNETALHLSNDLSITLKFSSPIFNAIGDYTYPFKLPATPLNVSILGYKHRIENSNNPFQVFNAVLEYNGIVILKGTLRILTAQSDFYEATLYMDKGDFVFQKKYLTLQDIDFGEMAWTGETLRMDYFNACRNYVYPDRNFSMPQILNKSYYDELPEDPANHYFNYYLTGTMYYFSNIDPRTTLVPMLYLRFVLTKAFEKFEYQLDDTFFAADPQFNALCIYNNVDANSTVNGPFIYDKLKVLMNYHLPRMTLNDFIGGLETFFNIRFFVNNITKVVKLVSVDSIVKSTDAVPFSSNVVSIYTQIGDPFNGFHLKMNMDTDDEFWTSMKGQEDLVKDAVQKISDLPVWPACLSGEIRWVKDENLYYFNYNKVWVTINNINSLSLYSEFIHHQNDKTIDTPYSTLMNQTDSPYDCAVGSARTNWLATSPKLFFVKLHEFSGYGTNDERVYASNFSPSHSLFYTGDNGLYNKQFKAFFDFYMAAKQVKIIKSISLYELNQLDFSKKYEINGNKYLLSEIQASITHNGIKPATIVAYTCF